MEGDEGGRLEEIREALGKPQIEDVQLAEGSSEDRCLVAVGGAVYDITSFLDEHPGGRLMLMRHAGTDASAAFNAVGHSVKARTRLADFYIGDLVVTGRLPAPESPPKPVHVAPATRITRGLLRPPSP
mmetsp:Transcript_54172/g.128271  ORF Transcript_54172/g.128271 Transcript_54172/m.128271 type:complete len:128 (-) Transcript_54172:128-511(-)